jgi:uncharacterized protein
MDIGVQIDRERIADFCRRWKVVELAFFGSVLRKDFRKQSDVDVLVTLAPDAHVGLIAFGRMEAELSEMLNRKVDLVTKTGLKSRIRDTVLAEAEVVYAA